ncbi:MAG: GYD domain-containing protein [Ignavibacteriaceae bacterium]|nr:GYD domain-containing protein [Ignavibacteriaceae bacterium]
MATYITLLRYTQQGMKNIKQGPDRLNDAKKAYKAAGAEIKDFYLTMGQYDAVVVSEAPDDQTTAKIALSIGALGNVQTETFRAFSESEYKIIVSALP